LVLSDDVARVVKYVDEVYDQTKAGAPTLSEVMRVVNDAEEFLRYFRDRTAIEASAKHIPATIAAMGREAKKGNVDAAKVLLEVVGLLGKAMKNPTVNVATQINLTVDEARQLREELLDDSSD